MATTLVFNPDRLRAALERSDVSRTELALSIVSGHHAVTNGHRKIRAYAEGRQTPKPETVQKLAAGLGVPVEELCDEIEWSHAPDADKARRLAVLLFGPDTGKAGA